MYSQHKPNPTFYVSDEDQCNTCTHVNVKKIEEVVCPLWHALATGDIFISEGSEVIIKGCKLYNEKKRHLRPC